MFQQACRPFEGTTMTVNVRNMVEKSAAHWHRPACLVTHAPTPLDVQDRINAYLSDPMRHVCAVSAAVCERGVWYATIVYQERNEVPS